ncbi:MAG: DUF4838 domain-containing protein, partial [candidate division WS1 bacterium]|nr:DUF4838 domain-containing protein [candidate division WS1 bacterium]
DWVEPFRHRAVTTGPSSTVDLVLDCVAWLPRVEMIAFKVDIPGMPAAAWNRWYEHRGNPAWQERRTLSEEEGRAFEGEVLAATQLRGLLYHRGGHGWVDLALRLKSIGGMDQEADLTEESRRLTAEVKGKRGLWRRRGVWTELCYSQPEAREQFIRPIVEYVQEHPGVDALHVWLSDAGNNTCECPECRRLTHSDWYMMLLNELAPRLREINPNLRVVFLCYLNTLWPPETVRPSPECDNLVFMFAPIDRCYQHRLGALDCGEPLPAERPAHNQVIQPWGNAIHVGLLEQWRPFTTGDSFAFDYHFWLDWVIDHLVCDLTHVIPEDIEDLAKLGLGGMMCCGTQRCFYPTALPMLRIALGLAGRETGEEQEEEYFRLAYGTEGEAAKAFLDGLDQRRVRIEWGHERWDETHPRVWWDWTTLKHASATVAWLREELDKLEEAARSASNAREHQAWEILLHFHQFVLLAWRVAEAVHRGERETAREVAEETVAYLLRTEPQVYRFTDTGLQLAEVRRWPHLAGADGKPLAGLLPMLGTQEE